MCRVSFHKSMVYNFMLSAAGPFWPSLFSGLDYWTGLLDWTTGLTETASGGERNKTILRFTPPYRKAGLFSIALSMWCSTQFDPGASARSKIGAIIRDSLCSPILRAEVT